MTTTTILDVTLSNPDINADGKGDFNILAKALGFFPDLVSAAGNPAAGLTVFAPTDQAFLNLANALDPSVGNDENKAVWALAAASALFSPANDPTAFLKTILTYHIVGEPLNGAQVASADSINTLSGDSIHPDGLTLGDKDDDFADPNVTNPSGSENGIVTDNGIIHVIDNVLLPYDVTISNGGFVHGGSGQDAVLGSSHRDIIFLGRGDDIANGLDGNDAIFGGSGDDLIIGGDGNDFLNGGRDNDILEGGDGHDSLRGGSGDDHLYGGTGNDYLSGGRGDDKLDGGDGKDFINGGSGEDHILGGDGNDFLRGGRNDDKLEGGDGHDALRGGSGNDDLNGGTGNDNLKGGRGDDTLTGAEGNDFLHGGRGADTFIFNPFREGEGHDVVNDFNPEEDKLVLDLTTADTDLLSAIAAEGEDGLQVTDFFTFDTDAVEPGIQAAVSLDASDDGDLLILHPSGTIELNGIPADVDPEDLLPVIDVILPEEWVV